MGMAVAASSTMCKACGSRTFTLETCQWCGKPLPGHEPRIPNVTEMNRHGGANNRSKEANYRNVRNKAKRMEFNHGNDGLVREMENFLVQYNMTASRFSRLVTDRKDPYLFERVTGGGNPRAETKDRIRLFMDGYRKGDLF